MFLGIAACVAEAPGPIGDPSWECEKFVCWVFLRGESLQFEYRRCSGAKTTGMGMETAAAEHKWVRPKSPSKYADGGST